MMAVLSSRPGINVALGGGGIKGLAHVGVLEALDAEGWDIDSIVGTSIGALIGALFAYNKQVRYAGQGHAQQKAIQALKYVCTYTRFLEFRDFNPVGAMRGLLSGAELDHWLEEQFWSPDERRSVTFEMLDFDLVLTTTAIATRDQLLLQRRDPRTNQLALHCAVRASASYQLVLPAAVIEVGGELTECWDGGTTGNCCFDEAARRRPDRLTVASSLTPVSEPKSAPETPWGTVWDTIGIMMEQIETRAWQGLDPSIRSNIWMVRPPTTGVNTMSFSIAPLDKLRLIESGRAATVDRLRGPSGVFH